MMKTNILFLAIIALLVSCSKDTNDEINEEINEVTEDTYTSWNQVYEGNNIEFRQEFYTINDSSAVFVVNTPMTPHLLKTNDGGKTWTEKDIGITTVEVRSVAFQTENIGYVSLFGKGVYRTTDGGDSWTKIHECTCGLTADSTSMSILNQSTMYYSTDLGETYSEQSTDFSLFQNPFSSFRFNNDVYMYFAEGLLESHNGGRTWENSNAPFSYITSITPIDSLNWYLIASQSLYKTTDAGVSWNVVDNEYYSGFGAAKSDTLFINRNGDISWTVDGVNFYKDTESISYNNMFSIGENIIAFGYDKLYRREY